MPDPAAPNPNPTKRARDPNFLAVVIASIVIVFLFFIGAWLFVHQEGRHLFPRTKPSHSSLTLPGPPSRPVQQA